MAHVRRELRLVGVVQGVGLRPWAVRRARLHALGGSIRNAADGVGVSLEGESASIDAWVRDLAQTPPPGLALVRLEQHDAQPIGEQTFQILPSDPRGPAGALPPDLPVCRACLEEVLDPSSRRSGYLFTHCADCGPRASVLRALPWDRERTTLAAFALCADCRREYADADDRRHHAEGIACPACGPRLVARTPDGTPQHGDPIALVLGVLAAGGIVALKGYGGFHLAVDASSEPAVARLRQRKGRPTKPLALLVPGLATARALARLSAADEALLAGPLRPVVVAPQQAPGGHAPEIAKCVAPTTRDHGLLLPSTPLHHLLFHRRRGDESWRPAALVFTSANRSGEPTLWDDGDALRELAAVADLFLTHDRSVARPCDDSVFRTGAAGAIPLRLSRAAAPLVLRAPGSVSASACVLAVGGDLKCAPALAAGTEILQSAHIGDLESAAAADAALERAYRLCTERGVRPDCVVHDLHPGYVGTRLARELAAAFGVDTLAVQHHHAHALAAALEHGVDAPCLAIVLDGLGWGADGTLWGGEILALDGVQMERLAHLEALRLPGGDAAAREPWRAAAAWLAHAFPANDAPALPWHGRQDTSMLALVAQASRRSLNAPQTSSCGRLFDAVASLLDCGDRTTFEGEAAIALEALATAAPVVARSGEAHVVDDAGCTAIPCGDLVRDVVCGAARHEPRNVLARRFHVSLAARLAARATALAAARGLQTVVLSGGCLQNRLLADSLLEQLTARGLRPLVHRRLPPNDGNLAAGQAWYGLRWLCRMRR